ncbi:MAG: sulfotransferase domain-containing protein [Gemmatimonadales bacterium]
MMIVWWFLIAAGVVVLFIVVQGIYLGTVLKWEDEQSVGLAYYGRTAAGREAFKRTLRRHAWLLSPILRLNAASAKLDFRKISFLYKGVAGPHGSCSEASFATGEAYAAGAADIFVVTQMKCGTTWMQHVVYEVLQRGQGRLVESGTAMYAVSPWLEGRKSVSLTDAPLIGAERPSRIIKTHFPAQLCPRSPAARYIYVARHPVSCFASCIDFVVTNVGGMAPTVEAFEQWYCSPELMWWGTWPDHVKGWWDRIAGDRNVLFLYFEDMKRDLDATVQQVAAFLGVAPLSAAERARVVEKCSFKYMQEHQDNFEMHPPHILQTNAELFVSGTADRHKDVPAEIQERIGQWSGTQMQGSSFPLARVYPDVAPSAGPAGT